MKILFDYSVKLGKYDGNYDVFQWEVESSDETMCKAFERARMTGTYLEDVPELEPLRQQAYREIEKEQIEKLRREGDDALALQCFKEGKSPFDCGYTITVAFADFEFELAEAEEIDAWLRDALSAGDVELAEGIVLEHYGDYPGNLIERTMEIAAETGCQEFIDKNKQ